MAVLVVLLPLLVGLSVVAGMYFVQMSCVKKIDQQRVLNNVEVLLGKVEVNEENALIGLTHFGITHHSADVDAIMLSLAEIEKLSSQLDELTKKNKLFDENVDGLLKCNADFVAAVRQILDEQKGVQEDMSALPRVPLPMMANTARLRRAIMETQVRPGQLAQKDANNGTMIIVLIVLGILLSLVVAGLVSVLFLQSVMARIGVVRHNCDNILQAKQLEPPLEGGDELAQLDQALYRAATALQELKEHRAGVSEAAVSDVIFALDGSMKIQMISESCAARWGFPPDYMMKKSIVDLVQQDDRWRITELFNRARMQGQAEDEFSLRHRSGLAVPTLLTVKWTKDAEMGIGIAHDLSQGAVTTGLLEARAKERAMLIKTMPVGVLLADEGGTVCGASMPAEQLFGASGADELCGKQIAQLMPPERGKTTSRWDDLVAANGRPVESLVQRGDAWIHYEWTASPFESKEGKRFIVSMEDVSDRYEIDSLRHELVGMVASDLKTPLTSMISVLQAIPQGTYGAFNDDGMREAKVTCEAVQAFWQMISDMSDIDRTEAKRMFFDIKPVEIQTVVEEVSANLLQVSQQYRVAVMASPQMVPAVAADAARLKQAMQSICHHLVVISQANAAVEFKSREFDANYVDLFIGSSGSRLSPPQLSQIMNMYTNTAAYEQMRLSHMRLHLPVATALLKGMGATVAPMALGNAVGYVLRLRKFVG